MGNTNQPSRGSMDLGNSSVKGYPVLFHHVHSNNVQLSLDKRRAKRIESFCKGICFGNRPMAIYERVYIKFAEVSTSWSGVLRFGYVAHDPATIDGNSLPRYACPDLTNKPGYWAKALLERYAEEGNILFFYVTRSGDVMYGVNGEEKGLFFGGVTITNPLWPLVDIYGNTVAMEFVDGRQLNNLGTDIRQISTDMHSLPVTNTTSALTSIPLAPSMPLPSIPPTPSVPPTPVSPQQQSITPRVTPISGRTAPNTVSMPPIRYHCNLTFSPVPFHTVMGRNVCLSTDRTIAVRLVDEYCNGYVFASRPLRPGQRLIIQILAVDRAYVGGMAFGMTSCDPLLVKQEDLPDDSDLLLDRPEYWVVNKDVCSTPEVGDELSFHLTEDGEVKYSKNGRIIGTLMFVDKTLPLWPFFDVYGSTQKIKILGIPKNTIPPPLQPRQATGHRSSSPNQQQGLTVSLPPRRQSPSPTNAGTPSSTTHSNTPPPRPPPLRATSSPQQFTPPTLPPKTISRPAPPLPQLQPPLIPTPVSPPPQAAVLPTTADSPANDYTPKSQARSVPKMQVPSNRSLPQPAESSKQDFMVPQPAESSKQDGVESSDNTANECTVCFEKDVDCALYTCGHMCMCYECAVDIKDNQGALCPICRQTIKDIIKIYRS